MTSSKSEYPLHLIGAGGHARSVIALLFNQGYQVEAIYDDAYEKDKEERILNVPVVGKIDAVGTSANLILAVGNNQIRKELFCRFKEQVFKENCIHTTAYIEDSVSLGKSNLIFGRAFLNACVRVGSNTIINTASILEHESVVGDHSQISVGAILCGRVVVGENCFIGAQAVIRDKIKIGDNVVVGAGAVVVKDIVEPGVYIGNPARRIK